MTDDALNDGVMTKSTGRTATKGGTGGVGVVTNFQRGSETSNLNDSGSKSRYFDIDCWAEKHGILQFPKASKRERNEGLEHIETKTVPFNAGKVNWKCTKCGGYATNKNGNNKCMCEEPSKELLVQNGTPRANFHPTVKPVHLMAWLIRLISKENDVVLDPFMGSGTTGVACKLLNRNFIGIELNEEYIKIAEARINNY